MDCVELVGVLVCDELEGVGDVDVGEDCDEVGMCFIDEIG